MRGLGCSGTGRWDWLGGLASTNAAGLSTRRLSIPCRSPRTALRSQSVGFGGSWTYSRFGYFQSQKRRVCCKFSESWGVRFPSLGDIASSSLCSEPTIWNV